MKKIISFIALFIITSCGTTAKFVYPSNSKNLISFENEKTNKVVAVIPFEDLRSDSNLDFYWVSYIPVIGAYGGSNYERPDAAKKFLTVAEFEFTPSEDLAKAAAYSLRKSGLFKDAYFSFGGDANNADYVLEGEIISTNYSGKLITYGLSFAGTYLWYLGLPAGSSDTKLSLNLKLKDKKKDDYIWKNEYSLQNSILQSIYYRYGHDVKAYSTMMEELMNKAIEDIKYKNVIK